MRARSAAALAVVAVGAVAAPAFAQQLGPHTTWYDQHPNASRPANDISIMYSRSRGTAQLSVTNFCLGSTPGQGQGQGQGQGSRYPFTASVARAPVHRGRIAYSGRATEYAGQGVSHVSIRLTASLQAHRAIGKVSFRGTRCGTIDFVAKLAGRTA
jgi:hypothetical protein